MSILIQDTSLSWHRDAGLTSAFAVARLRHMILQYYGMREHPFGVTPNPQFLYPSPGHREALATSIYGIEAGCGFMALVGKPGTGKTTLLFELLERLRNSARTVFLFQTQCDSCEFFHFLLSDMGIDSKGQDLAGMHEQLNRVLLTEARASRRFVLIIDEAQNLADSMFETVRLLSDFETPRAKLIQIILAGQPQLAERLVRPEMAQLRQRISLLARLEPFSPEETRAYIDHRLEVAGYTQSGLFTPEAMEMIVARGKGIPRDINNICFNALSLGFALQKKQIDSGIVQEVFSDLNLDTLIDEAPPVAKTGPQTELQVQEPIERDVQQGAQRIARLTPAFPVGVLLTAVFVTVCLVLLLTEKPKSGAPPSLAQTASASTSKTDSSSNIDAEQAGAKPPGQPYQGNGLVPHPLPAVRATVSGHSKVTPAEASVQVKRHPKLRQRAQKAGPPPSQVKGSSSSRHPADDATSAAADPAEKTENGVLATYRQAVQRSPTDPATHHNLARAFQAEGDLSGAAVDSARLADVVKQHGIDFDPTEEYLATLRKTGAEPVLLDALHAAKSNKSRAAGDGIGPPVVMHQGAQTAPEPRRQAESGAPSRPLVTSQTRTDTFRSHLEAGRALLAEKKPDEAVAEFGQALRLQPESAETHQALSAALFEKGDWDGAIAKCRQAMQLGLNDAGAHINLGLALYVKDDLDGSIAEFREAVRLNPEDPNSHVLLGNALIKKPDLDGSIAEFREAIRLRPALAAVHDALGSALEQKNDELSAVEQYRIANKLDPNNSDYRFHYQQLSHTLGH